MTILKEQNGDEQNPGSLGPSNTKRKGKQLSCHTKRSQSVLARCPELREPGWGSMTGSADLLMAMGLAL